MDSEGVTILNGSSASGVFVSTERDNTNKNVSRPSILRYDVTAETTDTNGDGAEDLIATNEWNLLEAIGSTGETLSTKDEANLGLEGIAFIPDSVLTAAGFVTAEGTTYEPAAEAHFGGLFFVALEKNGHIYAVSLDEDSNEVTLVHDVAIPQEASAAGFTVIQDLYYDADTNQLWAQCDNECGASGSQSAKLATYVIDASGYLTISHLYEVPDAVADLNTEGFALASLATASPVIGGDSSTVYRQVFWSDDSVTDGYSLRTGYLAAGSTSGPSVSGVSNGQKISVGARITATYTGLVPDQDYTLTLHSTPQVVAQGHTDAAGAVTLSFTIPASTALGDHTLRLTADADATTVAVSTAITVVAAAVESSSGAASSSQGSSGAASSSQGSSVAADAGADLVNSSASSALPWAALAVVLMLVGSAAVGAAVRFQQRRM